MINAFTLLVVVTLLCIGDVSTKTWSQAYVTAVLETRQCFDVPFVSVLETLFVTMNDTMLADQYATHLMIELTNLIHSGGEGKSLCTLTIDAVDAVYKLISWHKRQEVRRMAEKKVAPRRHMKHDATISHLQSIISSGSLYVACETIVPSMSREQSVALRACVRNARKESMRFYTQFTE